MTRDPLCHTEVTPLTPPGEESPRPTFIVGIGASAGGLEALEQLFERMPNHTGMTFVVVQHLSPDFKSLTDVLLARRTSIPIYPAENGMEVRPDVIYLIPPRKDMIISNGRLLLTDKDPSQLMTMPIDHFFRSVAQEAGNRAIGIVLSGTGSDGSRGVREIHDAGGLVIVQKPETAKFDGMPNSAEKTGVVDLVLAPEEMPDALVYYASDPTHAQTRKGPPSGGRIQDEGMDAVFRLLRDGYGIDFSHYRPATVVRRTERRMQLSGSLTLNEYAQRLENDSEELNSLYKDLLIGVTRFMRDREAFETLAKEVLPPLLQQAVTKQEEFRVWVAGCATGEEAYSLAILIREGINTLGEEIPVKIFATDAHRASLETASIAQYQESSVTDLTEDRLDRYFLRKGTTYQVSPELRKMVVFAQHNVIKDAPFTKLDLISCRNLLIYLKPTAQKKVLSLFHFGLKTGGVLLLGPSETTGELNDEFDVLNARWKVFRKRRDVRLPTDIRLALPPSSRLRATGAVGSTGSSNLLDSQIFAAYNALLSKYMPPSLLVNDRCELIQTFTGANRYLKHKEGLYSADVLEMVDPDLRMALTGALQRAFKEGKPVSYKGVHVAPPEGEQLVNVTVEPIQIVRSGAVYALISLEESGMKTLPTKTEEIALDQASREQVMTLEAELRFTKENLQATIEELETSNEELQATNEELVAANEELQSTNEELHSVNEELYSVNAEHQSKIAQLTELTTDIENLLTSTEVHTVFLDNHLRIRKFTPKIAETFNFLPQDIGRRIDSFTHNIDHVGLLDDLQAVLQKATPLEKQVRDQRGNWYLLRILPYRVGLSVEGVVVTLIDIGLLKRVEADARRKDQQLAGILKNSPNPIVITDAEERYIVTDDSFRQLVGCDPIGKRALDIFPPEAAQILTEHARQVFAEGHSVQTEVVLHQPEGARTYLAILFPLQDEQGKVSGVGNIMTDVTQLKTAESRALEAVTQRDSFLAMLSHELRNPLAAILNASRAAGHAAAESSEEWLQIIDRRARHVARLLDDLLDVARLTQNKIEIRKQVFDLASTVNDVIEEVQPWMHKRRIVLTIHRSDTPLLVLGDPARLQQIQVNLLMNAMKYTSEQGHVWYAVQREEDQAVIRVRDNGVGIPAEMLDRVFDLFFQVDGNPSRYEGGIGVGLTMVRSIVELHGGKVKAYSEGSGKGSEFIVCLPLARTSTQESIPPTAVRSEERPRRCRPGASILIVEDDEDIRETLKCILEHDGFQVRAVPDGIKALEALREAVPDAALLDLGLPEMSGYELARAIRQHYVNPAPRLVALTGYGRSVDRQATREAGFDAHLTKPLKPDELYAALARLLPEEKAAGE